MIPLQSPWSAAGPLVRRSFSLLVPSPLHLRVWSVIQLCSVSQTGLALYVSRLFSASCHEHHRHLCFSYLLQLPYISSSQSVSSSSAPHVRPSSSLRLLLLFSRACVSPRCADGSSAFAALSAFIIFSLQVACMLFRLIDPSRGVCVNRMISMSSSCCSLGSGTFLLFHVTPAGATAACCA